METQNLLFRNSYQIPEGLYVALMNKLKIDFDESKIVKQTNVIIVNQPLPKKIVLNKADMIEQIIKASINWPDREELLLKIYKMSFKSLKKLCIDNSLPIMKSNPYFEQQRIFRDENGVINANSIMTYYKADEIRFI